MPGIVLVLGDGTYLRASSKIMSPEKPLIGINSDPER